MCGFWEAARGGVLTPQEQALRSFRQPWVFDGLALGAVCLLCSVTSLQDLLDSRSGSCRRWEGVSRTEKTSPNVLGTSHITAGLGNHL